MQDNYSLLLLLLVPLLGAAVGAFMPSRASARGFALFVSLLTFALGLGLAKQMYNAAQTPAIATAVDAAHGTVKIHWGDPAADKEGKNFFTIERIKTSIHLGMDNISLWLVLLTVFLQPLVILSSWESIKDRATEYYAWLSLLLAAMVGVFIARDLLLFYVFFELTLVPMFFIIGIWGGPDRRYAAGKFFLYTFTGGVFTLAAVLYMGINTGTFDIVSVIQNVQHNFSVLERFWVFAALLAGFAVKTPLFPVHTWLPLAHTEAPTAGSVILAGVLLKLGTYGLMRLAIPVGLVAAQFAEEIFSFKLFLFFGARISVTPYALLQFLAILCVIGVIYGALVAWVQQDIKKLVAYSSVSHLGFCVLALLSLTNLGAQGSVLYMINHGLNTGAMFLVIGMIYDRYHTRDIEQLSGLGKNMPVMAFFFVFFVLASIGLPGTNGFVSEFLTIQSAFVSDYLGWPFGVAAATGVVLGAIYMLHMTAKIIFGPLRVPSEHGHDEQHDTAKPQAAHDDHHHGHAVKKNDLNAREIGLLAPIAIAVIVLGVLPTPLLQSMNKDVTLINNKLDAPNARTAQATAEVSLNSTVENR